MLTNERIAEMRQRLNEGRPVRVTDFRALLAEAERLKARVNELEKIVMNECALCVHRSKQANEKPCDTCTPWNSGDSNYWELDTERFSGEGGE